MLTALPIELSPVAVALGGALSYGSGDFLGGRAAARLSPSGAVAVAQCTAMVVAVQVYLGGASGFAGAHVAASGVAAGVAYAVGLMFLYQGIATGRVAVVVPVCGIVGILVPLLGDLAFGRPLSPTQVLGIAICALAILLLSGATDRPGEGHSRHFSFRLGAISGMGYGSADLMLGILSPGDGAAAFMVARSVAALISVGLIGLAILRAGGFEQDAGPASGPDGGPEGGPDGGPEGGPGTGIAGGLAWVGRPSLAAMAPWVALAMIAGVLDTMGHMSYVHVATQGGSMAVASALVALFPAVVVALAVVFLRERIQPGQYLGLAASLAGILMLSA